MARFIWTDECEHAFQRLKELLCSAPILTYPDFGKEFVLQTNASDYGVGAVLSQLDDLGNENVIAYASEALSPREQKYSTTDKEVFAVVFGTAHFRVYLLGRHFKLITDHNALRWLHTMEAKGRLARWIMDLQEFDFSVVHRADRIHNNADALSRLVPTNSSNSTTSIHVLMYRMNKNQYSSQQYVSSYLRGAQRLLSYKAVSHLLLIQMVS